MERQYFTINEEAQRRAKENISFSEYRTGSATEEYTAMVDEVYALAEKAKPEYIENAFYWATRYAQKLAEYINRDAEITCRCPSVMIAGPANFPVRKKQKQVAAWESNRKNWEIAEHYKEKVKYWVIGNIPIKSSDPDAIEKLERKLADLKELQDKMKAVNAYYRKTGTLEGSGLDDKAIAAVKRAWDNGWYPGTPFQPFALQNNNAEIHRVEDRIKKIEAEKNGEHEKIKTDLFDVVENTEVMRIQLIFPGKPDEETRSLLKHNGFRWSPRFTAWQRELNENGRSATRRVIAELEKMDA